MTKPNPSPKTDASIVARSARDEPGGYRTFVTCGVACGRSIELAFKVKIVLCYYQLFMLYFYDPPRQRMTPEGRVGVCLCLCSGKRVRISNKHIRSKI